MVIVKQLYGGLGFNLYLTQQWPHTYYF
ncbi:hypothetical protein P4S68_20655 [Pseudoalteromonas sp. Hal099]